MAAFCSKTLEAMSKWGQPLTKQGHPDAKLVVAIHVELNVARGSKGDFLLARPVGPHAGPRTARPSKSGVHLPQWRLDLRHRSSRLAICAARS
eukprot:7512345-Pyramimonas_sp.AAC.1